MTAPHFLPAAQDSPLTLYPHQQDLIARVWRHIEAGRRRPCIVAATGFGKTVLMVDLARRHLHDGGSVLVLAHRRELIAQTAAKLHKAGLDHGVILAGMPTRPGERVQVASVATLHARAVRGSAIDMPAATMVIVDEAHHVRARTYRQILDACPGAIVVGLTATPSRGDGRGLGRAFDVLVEGAPVAELIAGGWLVGTKVFAPAKPDLTGVRVERGDYVERQLAEKMDTPKLVGDAVTHWHRHAEGRPTVVFATTVAHSLHTRDEFRRNGVLAEHVDGNTPTAERDRILAQLAAGKIDVICNCAVLTEGWDQPQVSCLVLLRPTKSVTLYRQMIGRVLRPFPGKTDALVLDHAGAIFEHGFVEEPVEWSLDEDRRAESLAQKQRREKRRGRSLATCPECSGVRWEGDGCSCGWRPMPKAIAIDVMEGDLAAVDRGRRVDRTAPSFADKASFYGELLWIARERGWARGWAGHKFRERFGAWPRGLDDVPAQEPRSETRSWVRSRMIAYAKARSAGARASGDGAEA